MRVWVDTDMGFDDLAAIAMLAAQPSITIAGVSLIAGNAPIEAVVANMLGAANLLGWTMPIHVGRAGPLVGPLITAYRVLGPDGMPSAGRKLAGEGRQPSPVSAFDALSAFLAEAEDKPVLMPIGPLGNIAALLLARPELARRIGSIVWMGGSARGGNHTAVAEFNAAADPEAAQVVIESGVPLRMVGLDTCRQVTVTAADVGELRRIGTEAGAVLADLFDGYVRIASPNGARPQTLFDPVASAVLCDPQAVTFAPAHVTVELAGSVSRGATVVEWRVPQRAKPNAEVSVTADAERVRALTMRALVAAAKMKG